MANRRVIRISWHRGRGQWYYRDTDAQGNMMHDRKADLIQQARELCRRIWNRGRRCQLVIHGKNGRIQREYTYGADPRRYEG